MTSTHDRMGAVERFLEPLLFRYRGAVLAAFALLSLLLLWQALQLRADASFRSMVPASDPYIQNYLAYESELHPLGNVLRIAVERSDGDIFDPAYLDTLKKVTDEVFYIPGVDRGNLKSIWTPNVMWLEVTEAGLSAGHIIPDGFDGSPQKIAEVRGNVLRSGRIGSLVANDLRSAVVLAPLLETDPETGRKLDYGLLSDRLEQNLRRKYETGGIRIHINGFAKIVGDLINGARPILRFFLLTWLLAAAALLLYSRCWRSTAVTMFCCTLAVVWQLGIVRLLGLGLNPYSILVPFLTFAIGVSHAVQNVNMMAAECHQGRSALEAARLTFRALFVPGTVALLCDAVGFSTLLVIDIGVIRDLAVGAAVGVLVIIVTKMFLLPVLMSCVGVSAACLRHQRRRAAGGHGVSRALARVTGPRAAWAVVAASLLLLLGASWLSRGLKVGDLDPGAPELRASSRYNLDNAYLVSHYSTSPDVFVVMVTTQPGACASYVVSQVVDRFQSEMENLPGVESTESLVSELKRIVVANNGGSLKWYGLSRDRYIANAAFRSVPPELYNNDCSMLPVLLFLSDHKAETLSRVAAAAEAFARANSSEQAMFRLAAGNAGIEAATNAVIRKAKTEMLLLVYGIVALLVWLEFRSWRVTVALMLPLYLSSMLCESIMTLLGLGVKVATLPVVALGVGIGVDYGIYMYSRLEQFLGEGLDLREAYFRTLRSTGASIGLTGLMLALGVATWTFSEIKFQADMGLLLAFMFLWNMAGALILAPAIIATLRPLGGASARVPVL